MQGACNVTSKVGVPGVGVHDVEVVEKLIDACVDADVYDASDMKTLAEKADRVSTLENEVDDLNATIDELRQQIADLIA